MKKTLLLTATICISLNGFSQETKKGDSNKLLSELANNGCKCVDSINVTNKTYKEVASEINKCIDKQTGAYQMGSKLINIGDLKDAAEEKGGKKEVNITVNLNTDSKEYKSYYFEMERYMMDHCTSLKEKVAINDKRHKKSISDNPKAVDFYNKAIDESNNNNLQKAIEYYEKAVKEDPEFAFAWDKLGISYRKLNNYDKALESYKKSLEIDPEGLMPLQNIAIVYQYKKEFNKAIDAYKKLAKIDKNNPEVYYGIGNVYATNLNEYEKGLDNLCIAYNMYIEQKSPYRTDAETLINGIHVEMKKQGKEDKFNEILKNNHISRN